MTNVITPRKKVSVSTGRHRRKDNPSSPVWMTHVDGLRGLAILLVVVFHIWVGKVSSGVDVFLFLGGMFLLGSQLKNATNPEGLTFIQSLIRLARRLYPALLVVVLFTTIMGMIVSPIASWGSLFKDSASSATYWVNFWLWSQGLNYATISQEPSAFQHLWSMAVQVQVYVLIIAVTALMSVVVSSTSVKNKIVRRSITFSIIIGTISSFIYATYLNQVDQGLNYYSPLSRFWEIGSGALFGYLALRKIVLPIVIRHVASLSGLMMIVLTGFFLDGASQFPGPWALVPIIGAALVVSAGQVSEDEDRSWASLGVVKILDSRAARELGSMSYSLYLWHWTLLVFSTLIFGYVTWWSGVLVIAFSLLFAWLTRKYVEEPLRQKVRPERKTLGELIDLDNIRDSWVSSERKYAPLFSLFSVMLIGSLILSPVIHQFVINEQARQAAADIERRGGVDQVYPGASAFIAGSQYRDDEAILPDPNNLDITMPPTQSDGCFSDFASTDLQLMGNDGSPCIYGDIDSDEYIYVIGGSHSEHYIPALDEIGKRRGFSVQPIIKMGCAPYQPTLYDGSDYAECQEWTDKLVEHVMAYPPTMGIFMTGTRPTDISGAGPEIVPNNYVDIVRKFSDAGIHSWLIRDNPWMVTGPDSTEQHDARVCVSQSSNDDDIRDCGQPWEWTMADKDPQIEAYAGIPHVKIMDASPAYVQEGWVHPVVGKVLVYRDTHHLTSQFAYSMTGYLDSLMFPTE